MKYRPEIDGLRAVAVLPVILFHADFQLFSGGFVGVDVFFVISGYLITLLLIEDLLEGRFSVLGFYERRARRILPALMFVVLCCVPFAWAWMVPSRFRDFSESVAAVSLFASNVYFWAESGYFAAPARETPLLHTWSLAVEEQFYLFFPLLLLAFWRFGRARVFWIIAGISVLSFTISEWGWRNAPSANFYLGPGRAWELLAGSLCAFIVQKRGIKEDDRRASIGLVLILVSIFLFDRQTPFPSFYSLAPVVGVALILLHAGPRTSCARILSLRPLVGVGLISYSAYLWHQPLFAFARVRMIEEPGTVVFLGLSGLSLLLAVLSWRYVEQPFRKGAGIASRVTVLLGSGVSLVAVLVMGLLGAFSSIHEDRFVARLSPDFAGIYAYVGYEDSAAWRNSSRQGTCFISNQETSTTAFDPQLCLKVATDRPNVLLMGDSHAAQYAGALSATHPDINLMQATGSGCRPFFPSPDFAFCQDMFDYVYNRFLAEQGPLDMIILGSRWQPRHLDALSGMLKKLEVHSERIVVLGPIIEYTDDLPILLIDKDALRGAAHASNFLDRKRFEFDRQFREAAQAAGAEYVSIVRILCPEADGVCRTRTTRGVPMAFDYGHLTFEGALEVTGAFDFLPEGR